jgi:hypothetical protein
MGGEEGGPCIAEAPLRGWQAQQHPGVGAGLPKPCRRPLPVAYQLDDLVAEVGRASTQQIPVAAPPMPPDASWSSDPRKANPGLSVSSTAESFHLFHSSP